MRPRVLIIIANNLYVRNYVESGALDVLKEHYDLHFLVRDDVAHRDNVKKSYGQYSEYSFAKRRQESGQFIFDVLMLRYAKRSSSFAYRAKRMFPPLLRSLRQGTSVRKAVGRSLYRTSMGAMSSAPVFGVFRRAFIDGMAEHQGLARAIEAVKPSLVILPSSAYALDAIDVVKICRARGIRTLFLIDNWDNISSKSILWERPDHITVWGEQSKQHAVDIQGFEPKQVSLIGTPRFDQYFTLRDKPLESHFSFPYALFVGTTLPFNEARALQSLDNEIERNQAKYGGLKIVYRPHPWRQGKDSILGMNLKHVVLDPQVADHYSKAKLTYAFQPSLDYYPSLLKNALFGLGGVSSMLIETVIFAKRYLVFTYDEPGNIQSPKHVFWNYEHFRGLERLPGLYFCDDVSNLVSQFAEVFEASSQPLGFDQVDAERKHFLFSDTDPYAVRLQTLVARLMA